MEQLEAEQAEAEDELKKAGAPFFCFLLLAPCSQSTTEWTQDYHPSKSWV